jgi:hypothetical protein
VSVIQRVVAGPVNTWTFTANVVPIAPIQGTIYSDPARTVVAVAQQTMVVVPGFPSKYTGTIPSTLPEGHYYFAHIITTAGGPTVDANDELLMVAVSGEVTGSIDRVRRMTDETDLANSQYTDVQIQEYIDENTTVDGIDYNGTAASIWEEKAGYYSALVDVSESGSSRKMSDLYKNALAMAKLYRQKQTDALPVEPVVVPRPRVGSITRG